MVLTWTMLLLGSSKTKRCMKARCFHASLWTAYFEVVKHIFSTPRKVAFWATFVAQKAIFLVLSAFWVSRGFPLKSSFWFIPRIQCVQCTQGKNFDHKREILLQSWNAQKAGSAKLGFNKPVSESWNTQKAGVVAKIIPQSWYQSRPESWSEKVKSNSPPPESWCGTSKSNTNPRKLITK